ncbi:MAG: ABC transporter ATP-binding protein [Elainellaceae cyanobacterium]
MSTVIFDRVTKHFDDVVAVNNLNLTVGDREFLVLVGPSGCGKTTSLRMLAGLEDITSGHIWIDDRRVNELPPKDRDLAMVFQSYALYPHMSVFENMAFSLDLQGMPKADIRQRVEDAAKQMGIRDLLHRKPKELSGGQRQRVAVGRAIVRHPAVFLMDEPLSNLDARLRVQARAEISKLHQTLGTTFIYVTHDQIEAMTMGTQIAVMDQGILQQVDTPEMLYNFPNNIFVAGFIGSPAMNFFDAILVDQEDDIYISNDAFQLKLPSHKRSLYTSHIGIPIVFGIRPEAIHDPDYVPPGIDADIVRATITVTEMMGNEVIAYFATADRHESVARVDRRSQLRVGQTVSMVFDMESFHLFDPTTQERITVC